MKASNNAANEQLLLESADSKFATDWSHDGRSILYYIVDRQTSRDLWVVPIGDPTGRSCITSHRVES